MSPHTSWFLAPRPFYQPTSLSEHLVWRTTTKKNSDQAWLIELDSLEEERLVLCVRTAKYLDSMRQYYNHNVNDRFFMVGDLVLRKKQKTDRMHKLSSPWEGPFIVKVVIRPGFNRLCNMDERDVPNSWHIDLLRCFYP